MTAEWWQRAVVYQVYVRSFADGNGDGIGDLEGIRRHVPHIADLGADAVWLTPFYRSPMADGGYDVADYRDVDPLFGTLSDFDALLDDVHGLGLKMIVDVVPNHTSDEHPWFRDALAAPLGSPARRRYLFRDPKPDGSPPNNWTSVFGGPAWSLDPVSGQYYLHLFAAEQPDLNWRNPEVHAEMDSVLRFWLDRGVDGFRIDVAHGLYKHPDLADTPDPVGGNSSAATQHLHSIGADHLWDQPEVHDVYRRWRRLCVGYEGERALIGEVFLFDPAAVARYANDDELHQAFNFALTAMPFDAAEWRRVIEMSLSNMTHCTWVLSNHDIARHATRFGGGAPGRRRAAAATLAMLALPGAAYLYQGEELGLEDAVVPDELRQDPIFFRTEGAVAGRDGCRAPIPWTAAPPGHGFTESPPAWLPFPPDAAARAVDAQTAVQGSTLELYRAALRLRPEFEGPLVWQEAPAGVLAFRRGDALVAVNIGTDSTKGAVEFPAGARVLRLASDSAVTVAGGFVHLPPETGAWLW